MGLFDPVWKSNNRNKEEKAITYVQKVSDPVKLREIAETAWFASVQCAAVNKINDQRVLQELVLSDSIRVRDETKKAAISRMTDQTILTETAIQTAAFGDLILERITDPEMIRRIAMSSEANERIRERAVYRIKDQKVLADIAENAPGPKRDGPAGYNAKRKAADLITDIDILIGFTEKTGDPGPRGSAWSSLNHILRGSKEESPVLDPVQEERLTEVIIREEDHSVNILLTPIRNPMLIERIHREAARADIRAKAFYQIITSEDYPKDQLIDACKEIHAGMKKEPQAGWQQIHDGFHHHLISTKCNDPALMLAFVKDADTGAIFGSDCLSMLFREGNQNYPGIAAMQREGAAAFVRNIPAYGKQSGVWDEKRCILYFSSAIPKDLHDQYGLKVTRSDYKDEDQFGVYSGTEIAISYGGKTYYC